MRGTWPIHGLVYTLASPRSLNSKKRILESFHAEDLGRFFLARVDEEHVLVLVEHLLHHVDHVAHGGPPAGR